MKINALPTDIVRTYQTGAADANGQPPERAVSGGDGTPCRHCLRNIPRGAAMLVLAHRPFGRAQPYAETGPIFLCADPCERHQDDGALPEALTSSPDYLIKGYGSDDRIVYGTGAVTPTRDIAAAVTRIFADSRVAYIHVRSARNNCYQARIDRDQPDTRAASACDLVSARNTSSRSASSVFTSRIVMPAARTASST